MSEVNESWYYGGDGKAVGPHSFADLKLMAASGKLQPDTLITNGNAGWRPARDIPGLDFAPAQLGYRAPAEGASAVTARTVQLFAETSLWVRIASVLCYIGGALMTIGGLVAIGVGVLNAHGDPGTIAAGLIYIILAAFQMFIPAYLLSRYASQSRSFANLRHEQLLEQAVATQRTFWKYIVIFTLVIIGLYLLFLVGLLVLGVVFHAL